LPHIDEPIHLSEPQDQWPQLFEQERQRLVAGLAERVDAIEHIGSTAVPGLIAKPIVDILVGMRSYPPSDTTLSVLVALGYELLGEAGVPNRTYLRRRSDANFNLHVVEVGSSHWRANLALRRLLRASPSARTRYSEAKRQAVASGANMLLTYSDAKASVIAELLAEALRANSDA